LVKRLQESGAVFAEVPVHHYHRAYGRSQFFNFKRLWATGINLLKLWIELVLIPKMTGHKPVKSTKPPMRVDPRNPTLIRHPGPISIEELEAMTNGNRKHSTLHTPQHAPVDAEATLDVQERAPL